ncbi:MAG TPA: PKD domain-containing protein, partial [Solirubrobacterales bacterium]|nr:PKD domain-containing protein [Solirubrobacterales bacterium]
MNGVGSKKLTVQWVIVAAALAAGLAFAAPAQAGWGPVIDLTPPVTDSPVASGDADVAALPDGGFIYVWAKVNEDSSHDIVSRVAYPDGTLSPVNTVADGFEGPSSMNDPFSPSVATGDDGTIRAVWNYQDMYCSPSCDYRGRAQAGELDEDGRLVSPAQTLDASPPNSGDHVSRVSLSAAADGNALLAWRYYDLSANESLLRTAVIAPGQTTITPETAFATSGNMDDPKSAAADGGGGFVAVDYDAPDSRLEGLMVDSSGDSSAPKVLDPGPAEIVRTQALIDSEGTGTAVYQASDGTAEQIWMRKLDSNSDPLGAGPSIVSDDDDDRFSTIEDDSAAVGDGGVIAVPFSQAVTDGSNNSQSVRTIAPDGTLGPVRLVAQSPGGYAYAGSVALSPGGGGSVLYTVTPQDGPDQILIRELDSDLTPVGSPTLLDTTKPDSTITPDGIAYSGNGDAAALWIDFREDDWNRAGLRTSIMEMTPPELEIWVQPKAVQDQEIVLGAEAGDRSGVTVDWDFGDGGTSAGHYVKHTFTKAGTFDVKVTATDGAGNETVKTGKVEVLATGGPVPPGPLPPDTQITGKPGKKVKVKTATFKFTSSLTGSKFECRLDKAGWTDCGSPKKLKKLKPGKHSFKVR